MLQWWDIQGCPFEYIYVKDNATMVGHSGIPLEYIYVKENATMVGQSGMSI